MMGVCRLTIISLLLVAKNSSILASTVPLIPDYPTECFEELGINYNYIHETSELAYNRTCLTKCIYEKEGKLDSKGNIITSKFPTEISKAAIECLNRIQATDVCKKVSLLDTCILRNTDSFWRTYEECEKYSIYNEEFDDTTNHCYNRCQMIIDGSLDKNGKVNLTSFTNTRNIISHEEALKNCSKIVTDENYCVRDLNMFHCVNYILSHWAPKQLEIEFECGKESNSYPFFGVQIVDTSRPCYDRCLMIKSGDWDENDVMKSDSFKKLNMSGIQLQEAFEICKKTLHETDKCIRDLYFYDCINYLQTVGPVYLKHQLECARVTKSPLVPYRRKYKENNCNTRCLMIKENQLDINGLINRNYLKHYFINETIIDESINECNEKNQNRTCFEDATAYYCAVSKINKKINDLCDTESKKNHAPGESMQCYTRCLMIHNGQLTLKGEPVIDSFKSKGKNVTLIEEAIKTCKTKIRDVDECARVVDIYNCVSLEILATYK